MNGTARITIEPPTVAASRRAAPPTRQPKTTRPKTTRPKTAGYRDGDRHGWLEKVCGLLERIGHGKAAEVAAAELLKTPAAEFGRRGVVCLPMWAWVVPAGGVGRKGDSADGGQLLLPIRIMWDTNLVAIVAREDEVTVPWRTHGYSRGARGTTTVAVRPSHITAEPARTGTSAAPEIVTAPAVSRRAAIQTLRQISEDGRAAWWEAAVLLEPWLQKSLYRAHARISYELTDRPDTNGRTMVLSDTTIEAIADHMLLGSETVPGSVTRMLDACLRQDFAKVDPMRYIKTWLRRDAEEAIRRDLDDPKQGPKVRRLADSFDDHDDNELLAAYQQIYPADEVGIGRLSRALNVCADPMAERSTLVVDESGSHATVSQEAS